MIQMWRWISVLYWIFVVIKNLDAKETKTCSGTENGINKLEIVGKDAVLNHFKTLYENCTNVIGNLEITHLNPEHLNGTSETEALSFLSSIEEVNGYVLIYSNNISTISLPNLRIIWGDQTFTPKLVNGDEKSPKPVGEYGLYVQLNSIQSLDLRSLRTVNNGDVMLRHNPFMCHWKTIDFRQILGDSYKSRLDVEENFEGCLSESSTCSPDCNSCFGNSSSQCQQTYRDKCAEQCPNGMCYNSTMSLPKFCCNAECIGGCFGPNSTQCYGCNKMKNDEKCVDKCPAPEVYDPRTSEYKKVKGGKYAYHRLCVEKCPSHTVTYKEACLARCPEGYYHEEKTRHCIKCVGSCPKTCIIKAPVTEVNIKDFENCTHVEGFIHIGRLSFETGKDYVFNLNQVIPYNGLNESDLEALSNVQVVSDYILIESDSYLHDLNFLRNLQIIEGRRLFANNFALRIQGNDNVKYFGTVNLRKILNGVILIEYNSDLCYVYQIPWAEEIAERRPSAVIFHKNRHSLLCNESMEICHPSCDSNKGCWGPGAAMCYDCKLWKLNTMCVENCTTENGYFQSSRKVCEYCHPECVTCNGSSAFNCFKCKNVQQNGECVPECHPGYNYYVNKTTNVCERCHEHCFDHGCTGPGDFVGLGGCNKCKYGAYDEEKHTLFPCLQEISSLEPCSKHEKFHNYYWSSPINKFSSLAEYGVCVKCLDVCKTCSGLGKSEDYHSCECSSHRTFKYETHGDRLSTYAECDSSCPANHYSKVSTVDRNITECYPCHPQCEGCYGFSSSECYKCKAYRVDVDDKTFNCTETCPSDQPHHNSEKVCSAIDFEHVRSQTRKTTNVIIAVVMATVFLSLIIACIFVFVFRRRSVILEKLNIPEENYELNPEAKPDLSQLRLIIESELKRGSILGYGAFGTVFKGVWMPQDKEKMRVPVAVKVLHEAQNAVAQQEMLDEAGHMARVNHPYLVKLIGVCLGQQMMLVTPLMPLGNLLDYVQNNRNKIGSSALLRWCSQIASGMSYLEEARLVHRDLAARNVLVQNPYHVRITDFGLAKMLDYGEQELKITEGKMPIKWLALECIQYRRFTHKSDVWAYGVTVWELLTFGEKPYKDVQLLQIPCLLEKGERLPQPKICTLDVYMILIKCWMVDADSRPSFKELHETFSKMSKDPGRYLVIDGDKLLRLPSYTTEDQRDMMKQFVDDPDVCEFEEYLHDVNTPSSPTSPVTPSKPLIGAEQQVQPRNGHRLNSTTSHRYASDPIKVKNRNMLTMDMENYLVPDSQNLPQTSASANQYPTVTYTPVITGQVMPQFTDKQHTYYNELPLPNGNSLSTSDGLENCEYLLPNSAVKLSAKEKLQHPDELDLLVQNETVV